MDANRCMYCQEIIPEGKIMCFKCEHQEIKTGMILQNNNATEDEIKNAYEWLYANIDEIIDMC
jgi:hypothetical protein